MVEPEACLALGPAHLLFVWEALPSLLGKPGCRRIGGAKGKSALLGAFKPQPRVTGTKYVANPRCNAWLMPTATMFTHTPRASEERAQCHTSYYQAIVHLRDDGGDRAGND